MKGRKQPTMNRRTGTAQIPVDSRDGVGSDGQKGELRWRKGTAAATLDWSGLSAVILDGVSTLFDLRRRDDSELADTRKAKDRGELGLPTRAR